MNQAVVYTFLFSSSYRSLRIPLTLPLPKLLNALLLCLLFTGHLAKAQSHTFADTHPINYPDSLEAWLKANPKAPAQHRLTKLIALERTYVWVNSNKLGSHFPEIKQLVNLLRTPASNGAFLYLQAERALSEHQYKRMARFAYQAVRIFEKQKDTSGLIHAHSVLTALNTRAFGPLQADTAYGSACDHLQQVRTLVKPVNTHDWLMYSYWQARYVVGITRIQQRASLIQQSLVTIRRKPDCRYAQIRFLQHEAALYAIEEKHQRAYELNTALVKELRPDQVAEMAGLCYNLSINCFELNRSAEYLQWADKCTATIRRCATIDYELLAANYSLLRAFYDKRNEYFKANRLADSVLAATTSYLSLEMETAFMDQESLYAFKRRQAETAQLKQKQALIAYQNKLYLTIIFIALGFLTCMVFFAIRLKNNQRRLQSANDQLSQLIKDREYFFSIVTHDMRKPLISFQGLANLLNRLLKQQAYDKIQVISQHIDMAGVHLEAMLDNLRKWALGQRDSLPYCPQLVSLPVVLDKVKALYEHLLAFNDIAITVRGDELQQVWADPDGLELIIRNLLDNALKHSGPAAVITISYQEQDANHIAIMVTDNGPGMAPDKLAFLQAVLSGKVDAQPGEQGLGLGILLIRDFTRLNRGSILVVSSPDIGTTFTLMLPATETQVNAEGALLPAQKYHLKHQRSEAIDYF